MKGGGRQGRAGAGGGGLQPCYLLSVCAHVALQLRAAPQGLAAERAAEALVRLLVPVLDVLLQRRQPLVSAVTVGAGEQLGEVVG